MTELFFDIQKLTYQYADGTTALHELSLQIPKGKKIALLGHNGAGKSTLIQHLNGLLKPSSGAIVFQGEPLTYSKKALQNLRQQVGIVFQDADTQLFSGTVKKDIAFGPLNLGWSKDKIEQRVEWAMAQTETTELADRPIHFLSVGQKKRVAIAGVLAMDPTVMILDEPTAGLDNYYANQIMHLLAQLEDKNRTILLSTHDIQLAYEWADIVIVMHKGQMIYYGNPVQLFENEAILKQAHLERPWAYDIAVALQNNGMLPKETPMPKTKEQILALLTKIAVPTVMK